MGINRSNLIQPNIKNYAGPISERPSELPFGDCYFAEDVKILYKYNYQGLPIAIGGGIGGSASYDRSEYFSQLLDGINVGDLAYVNSPEGTSWLPGTIGGSYYPRGWYFWTGVLWRSDRNSIANQLQTNINSIGSKADLNHNHLKADITDFNDGDYASASQGTLAGTALQEGDSISLLVNDEVYLQPSDNVSALTNDAGYIVGKTITSYRSSVNSNVHYSGYLLNGNITIKKCIEGIETFATNLTDLEIDWTNRLTLIYI